MKNNMLIAALIVSLVNIGAYAAGLVEGAFDTAERTANTGLNLGEGAGRVVTDRPYEDQYGDIRYGGDRPDLFNGEPTYDRDGYERRGIFGRRRAGYYRGGYDRDDYRDGGYYRD